MYSYIKFKKKKCKIEGVKEVNRIILVGVIVYQVVEGSEVIYTIFEV